MSSPTQLRPCPHDTALMPPPIKRPSFLPERIFLEDVAERLAKINRFAGGTRSFFSVAQHALIVAESLADDPLTALYGLNHDDHEAWMSDIPATVAAEISAPTRAALGFDPVEALKLRCDSFIFPALGLDWPMPMHVAARVRDADARAFLTEARDVALPPVIKPRPDVNPFAKPIAECWPWPKAEENFIKCFDRFATLAGLQARTRRGA